MKKFIFLFTFFCAFIATESYYAFSQVGSDSHEMLRAVEHIYGKDGLNVAQQQYGLIKNTVLELNNLTKQDSIVAVKEVCSILFKKIQELNKEIKSLNENKQPVPEILFDKQFVFKHVYDYLLNYIRHNQPHTLISYVTDSYSKVKEYFAGLFSFDQNASTQHLMPIASLLLQYIDFEMEYILFDYKKLLLFFALKRNYSLPEIMDFWSDPQFMERMKKRAKKIGGAQTQALGLILTLGLQALIMAGGSMAMQWEDDADRVVYDQLTKDQEGITTSWQQFQKKLQNDQESIINKISNTFLSSQKKLKDLYANTNSSLQQEVLYINRSVNLSKPIERALIAPTIYDQYFSHARMVTPGKRAWYNIYQVSGGDWQFDSDSESFVQYGLVSFPVPPLWKKMDQQNASLFTDDPASNSIFTEYVFNEKSYNIEIECSIFNVKYPFFVGIFVNRGRWISGAPERIWQYRLLGLYGTESQAGVANTRSIDLCFAQQKLIMPTKDDPIEKIISPLQQIIDDKETHLYSFAKNEIDALYGSKQTFRFILGVQSDAVVCHLQKKEGEKLTDLFSKTINDLPNYIFMSGGIGFVASGCQASFRVMKPDDLQYKKEEIINFSNNIKKLMQ